MAKPTHEAFSDLGSVDSGPLEMLCNPNKHPQTIAIRGWIVGLLAASRRVIIPEIADSEVRRELLRNLTVGVQDNLFKLFQIRLAHSFR